MKIIVNQRSHQHLSLIEGAIACVKVIANQRSHLVNYKGRSLV
ncbi:MAG: hypothetical protein V7K30_12850 [Nostoc sp.]